MSERGSFATEFLYCPKCLRAARKALCGGENLDVRKSTRALPNIVAGFVAALGPGGEIEAFEEGAIPELRRTLCHPIHVAVLAEAGPRLYRIVPDRAEGAGWESVGFPDPIGPS